MEIIVKRFNKSKSNSRSKMAKTKQKTKQKYRRYQSSRSNFVKKIPVIGKIVMDRRVQKGAQATGTVELLTGLAKLVPNQTVQSYADNPILKTAMAFGIGDAEGAIFQLVKDSGGFSQLAQRFGGFGQQNVNNGFSSTAGL